MATIAVKSISYPKGPHHYGTSDTDPHNYNEELVDPNTVARDVPVPLGIVWKGNPFYCKLYELDDGSVPSPGRSPRYFGASFRYGITDISAVNVFFHPSPGYAQLSDHNYVGLKNEWNDLYRYMQVFGVQLAAASCNMVLVMPIFSAGTPWPDPGILKNNWRDILNAILVEVQKVAWPDQSGATPMARNQNAMTDLLLSCFSRGRAALSNFRTSPGVSTLLREIWDYDGDGASPPGPADKGQVLRYDQATSGRGHGIFHVPASRWSRISFYNGGNFNVHSAIPERLMFHTTTVSSFGH